MKKIFSILSAGLVALAAVSCMQEKMTVFDPATATAPVLASYELTDAGISATYSPGSFGQSFNTKMPVNHSLVIVSVNGSSANKVVSSSFKDNTVTATVANISKALMALGCAEESFASFEMVIRASMQEVSKDNGRNGHVDSEGKISVSDFFVKVPEVQGSPYQDYTELSDWTVIGSLAAYEMSWDKDLVMWTDGQGNHVAAHVTLTAADEFKFRKDRDWAVNMGGEFGELESEFSVTQDGSNIKVGADGVYDLFFSEDGIAWIAPAYDPYPEFTESSNWSVIGSLSNYGISWDGDLAMVTDGTSHVALSVNIAAADEFKFRQDKDWAVNMGGDFTELDAEFGVSQDGPNVKVGVDGVFDLFVNPEAGTAKVASASGAKVSYIYGSDEPEPEPEPVTVTGWNIIGLNGDWDNDVLATQEGNVWTAYITAEGDTEFKWRKDGGWDENYGGVMTALGEPFEAVAGGDNIKVGAGFYKVELDTENLTITVSEGDVWSLIGDFSSWSGDVDMVLTDGKWVSPATKLNANGFKIRHNHAWDESVGGTFEQMGKPFAAVSADGPNIMLPSDGLYMVTFDPEAMTITVDELGWGLVGTMTGWGNTPDIVMKEEGFFLVARNVTLAQGDEFKLRYNQSWDINRGGMFVPGAPLKVYQDGDNFVVPYDGEYNIFYRPDCDVIIIDYPSATELVYWGVVGTMNGWSAPDLILYFDENLNLVSDEFEISATDEFKLRLSEDWVSNVGGTFTELGQPFTSVVDGPNIKVGRDAKVRVVYRPSESLIMLEGEYTGDAPALPETMYMIGDGVGGWDWEANGTDMIPVNGKPGQFWAIRFIEAGKGFKFCSQKAWSGDFYSLGDKDSGFVVDGGNCYVESNGVYMIYVDTENARICVEPAQVYGIGDCFGGWDAKMEGALFTATEDGKLVGTTAAAGDIRLYAESSIATSDWWTREFVFFDGMIAYRGNAGDQDRVAVEAGKKVTLDFNAGTAVVE